MGLALCTGQPFQKKFLSFFYRRFLFFLISASRSARLIESRGRAALFSDVMRDQMEWVINISSRRISIRNRPTRRFVSVFERHGVAEVVVTVGNPAAVEADILRVLGQFLDSINLVITGQNTQMSLMVALTLAFFHFGSYYFVFRREFQPPEARDI